MFGKAALIAVLGLGVIFGTVMKRFTGMNNRAVDDMVYYHDVTKSHNLATVGANIGLSKLYQDTTLRGTLSSQSFTSGNFVGGSFIVTAESTSTTMLRLRSVSTFQSWRDTVEVYFDRRPFQSFSMFAWMTNDEGGVYWITKDTVFGRVHSNGQLNVSGSPVFTGKVTTHKTISPKPGTSTSNGIYKQGYETGVASIAFPTDLSNLMNASTSGGRKYTQTVYVTLDGKSGASGDGKVYVRKTSYTGTIIDSISMSDASFNGVIYGTSNIYVKGTVDGRLSVASDADIHIVDNVKYEKSPLTGTTDDMLGLVAENNIIVDQKKLPGGTTEFTNVEINGAIFSRNGSFTAENYSSRPVDGTLTLVGSVVQNLRGPVGTFSGSTLQSGFSKRYYYDPRYNDPNVRPPFFPGFYKLTMTIKNWWENVRIPKDI
jgi:cytoskeletal protein CcmA (bactofilin family)